MYKKPYKWGILEKYPLKYSVVLERKKSFLERYLRYCLYWPDDLVQKVKEDELQYIKEPFIFYFEAGFKKEKIEQYDFLDNSSVAPLVNLRTKELLEEYCPKDVQFFEADIQFEDALSRGEYFVLNILHKVDAIDMNESDYYHNSWGSISFDKIYFKENSMEDHWIARDKQELGHVLVSQEFKELFRKHKIKGPVFWTDQRAFYLYTPSHQTIPPAFERNFQFALFQFHADLEHDQFFQILSRKLHKIPMYMLDILIEKVSDLSDEGKQRLEKIKILVEQLRQKQLGS